MDILDYKKAFKELYNPKTTPSLIEISEMKFLQIDGKGDPNDVGGDYQQALELLYALAYTIKMSPKSGNAPKDYFEYVVPPLEGLWWLDGDPETDLKDKSKYCWTSMIRQPEFVTDEVFLSAAETVQRKKGLNTDKARLVTFKEGLCVQCMHLGSFDDEQASFAKMKEFMQQNGLIHEPSQIGRHHEIYLADPRKTEPSKRKTILRFPVRRRG